MQYDFNTRNKGVIFPDKLGLSFHIEILSFCGFHSFSKSVVFFKSGKSGFSKSVKSTVF